MPLPKETFDILGKLSQTRDLATDDLLAGIEGLERKILKTILNRINEMSSSGGALRLTNANATKLNRLKKELADIIKSGDYVKAGNKYLRTFGEIDSLTIDKYESMGLQANKAIFKDIHNFTISKLESDLLGAGLEANVINPLFTKIGNLVASGADFGDIQSELTQFISGRQGLRVHVQSVGVDTINQYNGAINEKIGTELDLNWGVYSGSIIGTSRGQCVRWAKMRYIHRSELQKEINFATNNTGKLVNKQGQIANKGHKIGGMISPTTPSSFTINRGGYGCRHAFTYVPDSVVPKKDKERIE